MQPPADGTLRILHLSDTHLTGDGALHQGTVDTTAALDDLLASLDDLPGVGLVVVSGDCSEDGSPESYQALRDRLVAWCERHGSALVLVPGNHDQREGFRQVLVNGHLLGEGASPLMHTMEYLPPSVPVTGMSVVAGRRIITVDTSVPGAGWGQLAPEVLSRLESFLASDVGAVGSVVVLHHPPLPAPTLLHEALKLQNPAELASVLHGSDVRLVLSGHYHHHFAGALAGSESGASAGSESGPVPVLVAPGVANDTVVTGPYDEERAVRGSGALVVDLAADGSVWSTPVRVVRPDDGLEALHHSASRVAEIAAQFGAPPAS
jgi:3',5'-cyclic-AMP phosphodiesterase